VNCRMKRSLQSLIPGAGGAALSLLGPQRTRAAYHGTGINRHGEPQLFRLCPLVVEFAVEFVKGKKVRAFGHGSGLDDLCRKKRVVDEGKYIPVFTVSHAPDQTHSAVPKFTPSMASRFSWGAASFPESLFDRPQMGKRAIVSAVIQFRSRTFPATTVPTTPKACIVDRDRDCSLRNSSRATVTYLPAVHKLMDAIKTIALILIVHMAVDLWDTVQRLQHREPDLLLQQILDEGNDSPIQRSSKPLWTKSRFPFSPVLIKPNSGRFTQRCAA
jgi:hypothetical protein